MRSAALIVHRGRGRDSLALSNAQLFHHVLRAGDLLLLETFGEECAILALAQFQCLRLPLAKQIRDDLVIDLEDRDEHRGLLADVLERRVLSDKDLVLVVILIILEILLLGGLFDLLLLIQVILQDFVALALKPSVNFLE